MKYRIVAPVAGVTATIASTQLVDSVGETDNESAVAYFRRHGYDVDEQPGEPEPQEPQEPERKPEPKDGQEPTVAPPPQQTPEPAPEPERKDDQEPQEKPQEPSGGTTKGRSRRNG